MAIISQFLAAFMLLSACGAKDAPTAEEPTEFVAAAPAPAPEAKPAKPPAKPAAPAEPAEASDELSGEPNDALAENPAVKAALAASDELLVPPTFPGDAKIMSATTYSYNDIQAGNFVKEN